MPTGKGGLKPVGQRIELNPGVAGRIGGGVTWLDAVGGAHLSLGLFGVIGEANPNRLSGTAALNTNGSAHYYGVMPFLSLELPVTERVNLRIGGGVGIAHRELDLFNSGARIVSVDGTALLAQVGGGVWTEVAPCVALGFDVFATHLGSVRGTGIGGVSVRLDQTWDIAATASVRLSFNHGSQSRPCSAFGP